MFPLQGLSNICSRAKHLSVRAYYDFCFALDSTLTNIFFLANPFPFFGQIFIFRNDVFFFNLLFSLSLPLWTPNSSQH